VAATRVQIVQLYFVELMEAVVAVNMMHATRVQQVPLDFAQGISAVTDDDRVIDAASRQTSFFKRAS
jgi:hypothetical protein